MQVNLTARQAALADRARDVLDMSEDAMLRRVVAEAVMQYAGADPPLEEDFAVEVEVGDRATGPRVRVPADAAQRINEIGRSRDGMGVNRQAVVTDALEYVVARADDDGGGVPTPEGVPPLVAPDPMGVLTRDARNPVVDPVVLLLSGGGGSE